MGRLFIIILSIFLATLQNGCNQSAPEKPCPNCIDLAFKIAMVDSTGKKLSGFTVKFINDLMDTAVANDSTSIHWRSDSCYSIFGKSGTYTIEITNENYSPISLSGIVATQNRCGINNTKNLTIIPQKMGLPKSKAEKYIIFKDSVTPGCGS